MASDPTATEGEDRAEQRSKALLVGLEFGTDRLRIMKEGAMAFRGSIACAGMVAVLITGLAACQTSNEAMGTAIGGVVGGVVGNKFGKGDGKVAATAIGAVIGAAAGQAIGASLDQTSRQQANNAAAQAFESGSSVAWSNPANSSGPAAGRVTVVRNDQRGCREYVHRVEIGGQLTEAYGTACPDGFGGWQIQ